MDPKKIVIVKLNKLGDSIAFIPTLSRIRRGWGSAKITLVTTRIGREVFADTGLADEILVFETGEVRRPGGFVRLVRALKNRHFDVAVASSDSSSFVALALFLAAIPTRIGFSDPVLSFLYNIRVLLNRSLSHLELNLLIADKLKMPGSPEPDLFSIPDEDKKAVRQLLEESGISRSDKFAIIHCGTKSLEPHKLWPADKFGEVAAQLAVQWGLKVVYIGEVLGDDYAATISLKTEPRSFIDLAGRTSIKQMIYLISLAELFVGHPSGPLQAAYLMGTPSVSMWGASAFTDWRPVRDIAKHVCLRANIDCLGCEQKTCTRSSAECMDFITVDQVIHGVSQVLAQEGGHVIRPMGN